jgi:hypothetical protein
MEQPRRPFDIGEEKRDRSGWQFEQSESLMHRRNQAAAAQDILGSPLPRGVDFLFSSQTVSLARVRFVARRASFRVPARL